MKRTLSIGFLFFALIGISAADFFNSHALGHGTAISPISRVRRVYDANPSNPNFQLAQTAVSTDGETSYYTWNELSRNIPEAVQAGLPPGFDYSPWVPDGQLASGGRTNPSSSDYPRTYAGLDQVSSDWPTTPATAGETLQVDFYATAVHEPSVWDVWMTTADWSPETALNWEQMEFLGRPSPVLTEGHYMFDVEVPADRSGHHVLWIAWQRDDPVGEVFFSTSDLLLRPPSSTADFDQDGIVGGADFLIWQRGFGLSSGAALSNGDGNWDGSVDDTDLQIWSRTFGLKSSSATTQQTVPEPSAIILVALVLLCMALARLKRSQTAVLLHK